MTEENKIDDGGPAYPETIAGTMDGIYSAKDEGHGTGMSKREVYAKAAMQGELSSQTDNYVPNASDVAERAVQFADALIEALKK